ncbi:hypothetical protein [Streptomyces sp. NPDC001068]|uniref:hypothetical protein n=1 Tax=Streptomyces sp. NPDC001068 TaxID=3364544 RepID=UPI0036CD6AE9
MFTPPRPLDIEAEFPELARHRKTATRLHPRPGTPGPDRSSVGGPLLWPAGEAWPVCREPHRRDRGRRTGETGEEPVPLLPVAQLFARDVPGLVVPDGCDLLQVLWCPFDAHGEQASPGVHLRWRTAAACVPFPDPPRPTVVGDEGYVPGPCVLDPEQVTEHQWAELLPEDLRRRIEEWEEALWEEAEENGDDVDDALSYDADFAVAPGWKVGGFARWGVTGPQEQVCSCGRPMELLLAIGSAEWEGVRGSWRPVEEVASTGGDGAAARTPTRVVVGRGGPLLVFVCSADPAHEHRVSLQ